MSAQWYYTKNGQRMGPVTDLELKQLATSGGLTSSDQIWKEGMASWINAGNVKGLFLQSSSSDQVIASGKQQDSIEKISKAGQSVLSKIGNIAERVGSITGEAINYDQNITEEVDAPGIILKDKYFGGRQKIGTSLFQLNTTGGKVMASIFSFLYMGFIVYLSLSAWVFLPFYKTDFIKISLKQSLRWEKLLPIVTSWFVTMSIGAILTVVLLIINNYIGNMISQFIDKQNPDPNGFLASVKTFFERFSLTLNICILSLLIVFYIYSNLAANSKFAGLLNYTRTSVTLDYGFPNKVRLISTVTDATIESQIETVLALCNAIEKANFAPWETVNHDRNNGLRTFVSTFLRKFTG